MTDTRHRTPSTVLGVIAAGASQFKWGRLLYVITMAGAAGASIVLLLLASSSAYAAVGSGSALDGSPLVSQPNTLFEELRDNFLMGSLMLGSVVLVSLVLPFVLSGLFTVATRLVLYAAAISLVITGAFLIASTWFAASVSSGAINAAIHRDSPRLSRIKADMRLALQVLMGRGIAR